MRLQEERVLKYSTKRRGALSRVINEGEPPGKRLQEEGVFKWLQRAGGPYLARHPLACHTTDTAKGGKTRLVAIVLRRISQLS